MFASRDGADWNEAEVRGRVYRAAAYAMQLKRCDGMAPATIKADAKFPPL